MSTESDFADEVELPTDVKLQAKKIIAEMPELNDDIRPGDFFHKPDFFDSIPRPALLVICAVLLKGPDSLQWPVLLHNAADSHSKRSGIDGSDQAIDCATALIAAALRFTPEDHSMRSVLNHDLGQSFQRAWKRSGSPDLLDKSIWYYRKAVITVKLLPDDAPSPLAEFAADVCAMLYERYHLTPSNADLLELLEYSDVGIESAKDTLVEALPWANKSRILRHCRPKTETISEDRARTSVACATRALELLEKHKAARDLSLLLHEMMIRTEAAEALQTLFNVSRKSHDSDAAIDLVREFQANLQPDAQHFLSFNTLLCRFFIERAQILDLKIVDDLKWQEVDPVKCYNLDLVAKILQKLMNGAWHARQKFDGSVLVQNLGQCRGISAQITQETHPFDLTSKKSSVLRGAAHSSAPSSKRHDEGDRFASVSGHMYEVYTQMSRYFYLCYTVTGNENELSCAVTLAGLGTLSITKIDPSNKESYLLWLNYSTFLLERHSTFGASKDVEDAIVSTAKARKLCNPANKQAMGECHRIAGAARIFKFAYAHHVGYLKQAIKASTMAIEVLDSASKSCTLALIDLGNAYVYFHMLTDPWINLRKALDTYYQALSSVESQKKDNSAADDLELMIYSSIGSVMLYRYLFKLDDSDAKASIRYLERALSNTNEMDRRYASRVSNLCYALSQQYIHSQSTRLVIFEKVTTMIGTALQRHSLTLHDRFLLTEKSAMICLAHYQHTRLSELLEEAIRQFNEASQTADLGRTQLSRTLCGHACALWERAKVTNKPGDWNMTLRTYLRARSLLSIDSAARQCTESYIGRVLYDRWNKNRQVPDDAAKYGYRAIDHFSAIIDMRLLDAESSLSAAERAADLCWTVAADKMRARDYICKALVLLPESVLLHATRLEQLNFVRSHTLIPSHAAALSLDAGDPANIALSRMESGRCFLLHRQLDKTSSIDDLQREHAELADKFLLLRSRLATRRAFSHLGQPISFPISPSENRRDQRERDSVAFQELVKEIQSKHGFENFLKLSDKSTEFQSCAFEGPIVYLNVTKYRCDAIVLSTKCVYNIPLPLISFDSVIGKCAEMIWIRDAVEREETHKLALEKFKDVMEWLWLSAAGPILDNIDFGPYRGFKTAKPRLFWVITGLASILPLHAAGCHRTTATDKDPRCVHDLVISTYITSIRALKYARERAMTMDLEGLTVSSTDQAKTATLVAMRETTNEANLPDALNEIRAVHKELPSSMQSTLLLNQSSVELIPLLESSTIAYLACHSKADQHDPTSSAILLSDHQILPSPLSVRAILQLKFPQLGLVYLSSCETNANKDVRLTDEGMTIAGAFHLSGVPHVISSVWQVDEQKGVPRDIATKVFHLLVQEDRLTFGRCAEALHQAVGEQREKGVEPYIWCTFVHSGC